MTTSNQSSLTYSLTCWAIGALLGAFVAVALMITGGWLFIQAVFIGGLVFVIGGALISWMMCGPLPDPVVAGQKPGVVAPEMDLLKPAAAPAAAPAAPVVKSSAPLAGEAELAERKGNWTYGAADAGAVRDDAEVAGTKPQTLDGPREGGPDDLQQLKGVGPKLEGTLHDLGFYHFDQIAAWTEAEVCWVNTRLKFKGRIERDGWIEQAKAFAAEKGA